VTAMHRRVDMSAVSAPNYVVGPLSLRTSASLLVICVLLLALFPAATGSFSAVHGPVTAMRAARAGHLIHAGIALCASALSAGPLLLYTDASASERFLCPRHDPASSYAPLALRC
jgi:hypothetical protein